MRFRELVRIEQPKIVKHHDTQPCVPYFGAIGEADLDPRLHVKFRNQVLGKTARLVWRQGRRKRQKRSS